MRTKIFTTIVLSLFCSLLIAQNVVFLKNGGTGDGTSAESPVGSITTAYTNLGASGGTIVICDDFELTATFTEPAHTGLVTITQVHNSVDYRGAGGTENTFYITSSGKRFVQSGPTKFENINFHGFGTSASYIFFIANYFPITMGEGIHCDGFQYTSLATSTSILGGYQSGQGTPVATNLDSHITIQSGKFLLVGFNRSIAGPYTGTAHIDISGGEIVSIFGGSASGTGGALDLNITGGVFSGPVYASNYGGNMAAGSVNVTISGGNFTTCPTIVGGTNGAEATTTIDISDYNEEFNIMTIISNFDSVIGGPTTGDNMLLDKDNAVIYPIGNTLYVKVSEKAEMSLYSLSGQKIITTALDKGLNSINFDSQHKLYIVQLRYSGREGDSRAYKVMLQ
ncbi:MAG: hypothetical protein VB066_11255 [Paludibacter sp.]|nr:hypothetical protein [Paludibacter sp.]